MAPSTNGRDGVSRRVCFVLVREACYWLLTFPFGSVDVLCPISHRVLSNVSSLCFNQPTNQPTQCYGIFPGYKKRSASLVQGLAHLHEKKLLHRYACHGVERSTTNQPDCLIRTQTRTFTRTRTRTFTRTRTLTLTLTRILTVTPSSQP